MNAHRIQLSLTFTVCLLILPPSLRSQGNESQLRTRNFRFVSGDSARDIPFHEDAGHIGLQIRINNSAPLWFALDTGATRSLIDTHTAQRLGLKSGSTHQIEGAGGYETASIFDGVTVTLPGVELYSQVLWGLPLDAFAAGGRTLDGIIGYELFRHFVVDVDYAALKMNLYDTQNYSYHGAGQTVPLTVQKDG